MELVYLWVEDYKNIHEQGFNFSPRFHCEYDDIKKELTIDENNDYISDFFGENINVTAIVGKNGSGKSSVLKNILENILKILFRKDANVSSSFEKFIKLFIVKNNEKVYILYQGEIANKSNDYEYILIPYIFSKGIIYITEKKLKLINLIKLKRQNRRIKLKLIMEQYYFLLFIGLYLSTLIKIISIKILVHLL